MKYFFRSLKYLKPYRVRIGVAIVCVLFIAGLWGGGLGMMLPGAKILLSEEGLHGWAWKSVVEDGLQIKLVQRVAPAGAKASLSPESLKTPRTMPTSAADEQELSSVLDIISIKKDCPANQAGLHRDWWIVGIKQDGQTQIIRSDALLRTLANVEPGTPIELVLRNDERTQSRTWTVTVSLEKPGYGTQALAYVARKLPEPKSAGLTPGLNPERFPLFVYLLIFILVLTILRAVFTFIQEYLIGTAIWQGIMDMRCDNYNTVLHLPTTFFSDKGVSDATSRFIQDTNELARGQNTLFGKTLVEPAKAISTLALAVYLAPGMTLMAMLGGPLAFLFIRTLGKNMHRASRRALESWSTMLEILGETLIGIRVVKSYTMEGSERKRFFRINRELLMQQNRMERLDALSGPMVEALGIAAGMGAAAFAGYLVFCGIRLYGERYTMEPENFLVWMAALFALFDPVRKLAKVSLRFHASDAAAKRIFELQDTPVEKSVPNAPMLPRHSQSIEFRGVCYHYPGATDNTLHDINLTIRAGETVAIVGPNGSGKTTLVSLVPRLLDPQQGGIYIDGLDVSHSSVRSLRRQIGLVTQDAVMFHATIADNIAYGLRRAKRQQVLDAATQAYVAEFLDDRARFPEGYDTMVGEHGTTLSGGQKQRIAIARAILRNPSILIFDEAMSQVDSDSEQKIHEAMQKFMKGRTSLLIAHRFVTVTSADRIVVMDKGRIIDIGRHDELLTRCELYHQLYRNQFQNGGSDAQ